MPANLTPQYQKAEAAYRRAHSPLERVECLEQMLTLIPKHKGTEKLQADLKSPFEMGTRTLWPIPDSIGQNSIRRICASLMS